MWIYIDDQSRVLGYNPNNMAGNTGWIETHDPIFTPPEEGAEINVSLFDYRDIALYKYDAETDAVTERTQEEMDADWVEPVPTPNPNEKITQLEQQVAALSAALLNL